MFTILPSFINLWAFRIKKEQGLVFMKSIAHKLVGCAFERQLLETFPTWTQIRDGSNRPDFDCGGFYVEAKGSYVENGGRPKWYQFGNFPQLDKPVLYAFGYHHLYGIQLLEKVLPSNFLISQVNATIRFNPIYFVSSHIVHAMLEKEFFTSKKEGEQYFCIKPRHLDRVIDGESFKRKGVVVDTQSHYGLDRRDFILDPPKKRKKFGKDKLGFLLNIEHESKAIDFFNL